MEYRARDMIKQFFNVKNKHTRAFFGPEIICYTKFEVTWALKMYVLFISSNNLILIWFFQRILLSIFLS